MEVPKEMRVPSSCVEEFTNITFEKLGKFGSRHFCLVMFLLIVMFKGKLFLLRDGCEWIAKERSVCRLEGVGSPQMDLRSLNTLFPLTF